MKYKILIIFCLSSVISFAQYRKNDGNRIGITGGVTLTNLYAPTLKFKPETGWIGGLSVRGNFYNDKWSMIYGMQFTESKFSLNTTNAVLQQERVTYKLSGVQVRILGSYHLIADNLAFDFGPVLQINGKLKIADESKTNVIVNSGLTADEITAINQINGNLYLGLSGGGRVIRANLFYQYGITNMMGNLNDKNELKIKNNNKSFNAHMGMISGQLTFNL